MYDMHGVQENTGKLLVLFNGVTCVTSTLFSHVICTAMLLLVDFNQWNLISSVCVTLLIRLAVLPALRCVEYLTAHAGQTQ